LISFSLLVFIIFSNINLYRALRKTSHVLLGLAHFVGEAKASSPITYYALDLEQRELERALNGIETSELGENLAGRVKTKGMWGTYNDGLKFIEEGGLLNGRFANIFSTSPTSSGCISIEVSKSLFSDSSSPSTLEEIQPPLHILFLGSSLGNFSREGAADFLRSLPLRPGTGDTLLLGLDHDNDKEKIEKAYNDSKGYTANFIFNGLRSAGRVLGNEKMFDEDKWEYVNRYNIVRPMTCIPSSIELISNPLQAERRLLGICY
jgi:L-histidine Nalpha-methyltransferase / hercynylcysteine S-oxide synthase